MKREFHPPVFLLKHLTFSVVTFCILLYLFTTIEPKNPLIVLLFLFVLFVFLASFLSTLTFVTKYRADRRVWYIKENNFIELYNLFVFVSLSIVLALFLSYIKQVNYLSVGLVLVTCFGGYFLYKKRS